MSDTTKFEQFDKYDFDNDAQFKAGLASLLNNKQSNESELLEKAKLFYYTRFKDSFDIDEYKDWKKSKGEASTEESTEDENPPRFTFQEIVDMIEKGIEIPGIKKIPNVLNEGKPSESKMKARPKPWETKAQS
ncbi:hypothetical protein BDB01DRAFT_809047 [Pilobolus umbonatus]|nr:hypothetical protein BDB01DRAFT_809047 [Pilobolus umbonatus]